MGQGFPVKSISALRLSHVRRRAVATAWRHDALLSLMNTDTKLKIEKGTEVQIEEDGQHMERHAAR
jgi:hypothetical protein